MEKLIELKRRLVWIDKELEQLALDAAMEHYDVIIDMNVEDQLFKRGIDSTGNQLPSYSPVTIHIKQAKGQPTDRMTLRDEGDFHSKFRIERTADGLRISSDDAKTEMLIRNYGEEIFGLTDDNFQIFLEDYFQPQIKKIIHEQLNT